jgi:hypothetical protein
MAAMLSFVQRAGGMPRWMAAFSAGIPNESHPIGWRTASPRMRRNRATASPIE